MDRPRVRTFVARRRGITGFVAGMVAALVLTGGGVALAAIPSSSTGGFTGCVDRTSGALRVIDYQAGTRCAKKRERTIQWSKGWSFRGSWTAGTAYKVGDVAVENGSSYLARSGSTGKPPAANPAAWGLLAAAAASGAPGPAGPAGPAGPTGPSGATGAAGADGPVTLKYVTGSAVTVTSGASATSFFAACPSDLHALSGGASITGVSSAVAIRESYPYDAALSVSYFDFDDIAEDGWAGYISNTSGSSVTATPYVICSSATSIS